jgi:superfamily II DNA helicase RecQ
MAAPPPIAFHERAMSLASDRMYDTFGYRPYPWQSDVLLHLYAMASSKSPVQCQATFLCQPTGGGKSMVRDTFAATVGGVTLNIAPLLALSADQHDKLLQKRLRKQKIMSIHLDTTRNPSQQEAIVKRVMDAPPTCAIILFSSPQALVNCALWRSLLFRLLRNHRLKLVCIDEIHLFAQFGLWFRSEFFALRDALFKHLLVFDRARQPHRIRVPILGMTATANALLLRQCSSITGLTFKKEDIFWPSAIDMVQRAQSLQFIPSPQALRYIKPRIVDLMRGNIIGDQPSQFIVYSNSRVKVETWHEKLGELTDEEDLRGDIVLITGPMSRDQKFHRTQLFLRSHLLSEDQAEYNAIGCLCPRALGSAGWDSSFIRLVCSMDFPTDILSLVQEKGRTGRHVNGLSSNDSYLIVASFEVYCSLLLRILKPLPDDSFTSDEYEAFQQIISYTAYQHQQVSQLHEVIRLLVLPRECQQVTLERQLSNPFLAETIPTTAPPCGTTCQYCVDGGVHPSFPRIHVAAVREILIALLLGQDQVAEPDMQGSLVTTMAAFPNANLRMFGSKSEKPPSKATIRRLLLMLFASDILVPKLVVKQIPSTTGDAADATEQYVLIARPALTSTYQLALHDPARWVAIPTIN